MPQVIVFLEPEEEKFVKQCAKVWNLNSKYDAIKKIINEYSKLVEVEE